MQFVRPLLRLSRVGLHLLQGTATVALFYPLLKEQRRLFLKQRWSSQLLAMLGMRLQHQGVLPQGFIVSNHISFIDIFVLNALAPAAFVAKDDVRAWPLIGWLCQNTDTLFMARGSFSAAQKAREGLYATLRSGKRVALFPEGTTSLGDQVLPFHAALFQAALDSGVPIQPVSLRYTDGLGQPSVAPAYVGEISLLQCLWAIASTPQITAVISVCPEILPGENSRRELAELSRRLIADAVLVAPLSKVA